MSDRINLSPDVRQLPIYLDGLDAGRDVGLAIALHAVTQERIHQEQLADQPDHPGSPACREYANGVLLAVSKRLAGRFIS